MKFLVCLPALTLALFLVGCASDPYTKVWITRTVATPIQDNRIQYETGFLPLTLPVSRVSAVRRNDRRLKVQVSLENVITATQVVAYKIEWFDPSGMAAPGSSWNQKVVLSGGTLILESSAPSVKHGNFRLTLRSAQLLKIVQEK